MRKITLLFLFVLATTLGFTQNVFTDGTFDNPSAWTIIQQNTNNNGSITIASGVATYDEVVDIPNDSWGQEAHVAMYKAFTVAATGWYQFDADVTANGIDQLWFELWVGTAIPIADDEYNAADGASNILALNAWDCGASNTYTGSWLATGCKGLDGKIQLDAGTTYYALVRSGGFNFGVGGVIIDNITLVTTDPPPAPITDFNFDFDTPTGFTIH